MSSSPALGHVSYAYLFLWGELCILIVLVAFLSLYTSLGHPLRLRLSRLGDTKGSEPQTSYAGQFNASELEAHAFECPSSHPCGTPAPPYEWVLKITPPPPPMAHFLSEVAHIAPTLTHRYSDIPRVSSGDALGIQVKEDLPGFWEKDTIKTLEKANDIHSGSPAGCTETHPHSRTPAPSVAESLRGATAKSKEGDGREAGQGRYHALLRQNDKKIRREIYKSMPEDDRAIDLAL